MPQNDTSFDAESPAWLKQDLPSQECAVDFMGQFPQGNEASVVAWTGKVPFQL